MRNKDFDRWNEVKKTIESDAFVDYVNERDIWWCSLGVNIGFEQDGKNDRYERPVLILKKFNNAVVLVIPLTSKLKEGKYYYRFMHQEKIYIAIISQLRLISTKRLRRKMYRMDASIFELIRKEVKEIL